MESMSHLAFVKYCYARGLPPDLYDAVPYPHPYLVIWMECRRAANPLTGVRSLPEPEKGVLDQDAELMLACEVLDDLMEAVRTREEQQARLREEVRDRFRGQ